MSATTEQIVQAQDSIALLGRNVFTDSNYDLTEQPIKDDSTLEVQEYQVGTTGISDLTARNNEGDIYEFEYMSNEIYNPSKIYFKMNSRVNMLAPTVGNITGNITECFSRCEFYIGSELVENINFVGRADTIMKLLYCGSEWATSSGSMCGFAPNIVNSANTEPADPFASARLARAFPTAGTTEKYSFYCFNLPIGFMRECKKYVKGIPFRIRLFRNSDSYIFEKTDVVGSGVSFTITKLTMMVPCLKPNLERQLSYDQSIVGDYLLQYNTCDIDRRVLPNGERELNTSFSLPACPAKVFIFAQNETRSAVLGIGDKPNPMAFDNMGIRKLEVIINNKRRAPFNNPIIDFGSNDYVEAFRNTIKCSGAMDDFDSGSIVNYGNFKTQYPIFGVSLEENPDSGIPSLNKVATKLDLRIELNVALGTNYYIYVMFIYNTVLNVKGTTGIVRKIFGN